MGNQPSSPAERNFRYVLLANELEERIREGVFKPGDALPSLRRMHKQAGLSLTTVYQAYMELEKRGFLEPRQRSGFYVKPIPDVGVPSPALKRHRTVPGSLSPGSLLRALHDAGRSEALLELGNAVPSPELLPYRSLSRFLRPKTGKRMRGALTVYDDPSGVFDIRREIAKRCMERMAGLSPEDIVMTNGCLDAVHLCLRAVARPGDAIALEAPAFFGLFQLIQGLGMHAVEIPADPRTGVDMDALHRAIRRHSVRACLLSANFQNPLGVEMPAEKRKALVESVAEKGVPIVENDVFGELHFEDTAPGSLKSHDTDGAVLYCSSFSKCLAPGLRVGWTLPGRFRKEVLDLKLGTCMSTPSLNQQVIADYMESGAYGRNLRKLRNSLRNQAGALRMAVARSFPEGTEITDPRGGLSLWVRLGKGIRGVDLFRAALRRGISILPGELFSVSGSFGDCIRLAYGRPWTGEVEEGIERLGEIAHGLSRGTGVAGAE